MNLWKSENHKTKYQGHKSDMSLGQHGGEGGGKSGTVPGSSKDVDYTPSTKPNESYTGPGRFLKSE